MRPKKIIKDPFRREKHLICLCDTYNVDGSPTMGNFRYLAEKVFKETSKEDTWFGMEQEYILYHVQSATAKYPIGYGPNGYNAPQGLYYCGVGSGHIYGRAIAEDHIRACIWAGLDIAGLNAETFPGQWEYQVGVCKGIDMCDQLWLSRYILQRIAETYGMLADFTPKPVFGEWHGSGCHINYSTKSSRNSSTGWETLMTYCDRLKKFHDESMQLYGIGNIHRLTGKNETARFDEFTYGIGNRSCSVRIGNDAKKNGCGYMEERRPASNTDPYLSVSALADVTVNNGANMENLILKFKKFRNDMEFHYME